MTRISGDSNGDSLLQSNETWTYTCSANVPVTSTNTAIAIGHANGLTAIDTALATVTVAGQGIPPLIHIVKKPVPIVMAAPGGRVTYTYAVTNPGTIPLSGVGVTDDKCGPVNVISGDANGNGLLDTAESWIYACNVQMTQTTTNTATATGQGNGLTVTDVAVANVVVSPALVPTPAPSLPDTGTPVPNLPNTGFGPGNEFAKWIVLAAGAFIASILVFALTHRKRVS
ncbi:MAG: hypothetical protein ABIO72_02095 [Patescibacteria group bacterium]